MIVVSDTSSISNLLLINHLLLLKIIYKNVFIPPAVYKEIVALEKGDANLTYFWAQEWILQSEHFTRNLSLSPPTHLHPGEAEAIDLAIHLKADRLLIDERKGTLIANQMGIITIGLPGVLIIAKENQLIYSVKEVLDQLIENGFWISDTLYHQVLKPVYEQ